MTIVEMNNRKGEAYRFLPVAFICCIIGTLWAIYIFAHCLPLFELHKTSSTRSTDLFYKGLWHFIVFNITAFMLILCYTLCIVTNPGTVPDTPEWSLMPSEPYDLHTDKELQKNFNLNEIKRSGERRSCKWCGKYKPDRCHHCRICRRCVLKMDHHCPWIFNCVGYHNHKYFILLLFYSVLTTNIITITMFHSVKKAVENDAKLGQLFALIFGETLAALMSLLVTTFMIFHLWLVLKAMTTIEFCEKTLKKSGYSSSAYQQGIFKNICDVLGPNPLYWLLPTNAGRGTGLHFDCSPDAQNEKCAMRSSKAGSYFSGSMIARASFKAAAYESNKESDVISQPEATQPLLEEAENEKNLDDLRPEKRVSHNFDN